MHHGAHERYAQLVASWAWPDIAPSEVGQFLDLVEVVWETRSEMVRERLKSEQRQEE